LKRVVLAVVLLLGFLPRPASAAGACSPPRCLTVRVPVPGGLKVPDSRARILLPAGYQHGHKRYSVLYLLHGVGDTFESWTTNTDIATFSRAFDVIIVMPDGGKGSDAGWYSDWKDGSRQWESFHIKVLIPYIDKRFRTLGPRHRAIAGISMGGFGAMSYAARHPKLFRAAASLSGFTDTRFGEPASGLAYDLGGQGVGGQSLGSPRTGVWGDQMADEAIWRAHNPTDLAAHLDGLYLYVASGNGQPLGTAGDDPTHPYAYPEEYYVYQDNQSFTAALNAAHVPFNSHFYDGYHGWPYWQYELHDIMSDLSR
jgi:S-formylglutathione hydrolase FrmB